jgi:aminoglycoside phosphotransferase (APT) family kinase protein
VAHPVVTVPRPAGSPPGLDVPALQDHLQRTVPGLLAGRLTAQLLAGGRSNLTYLLSDGVSRLVLRRPPLGHVLETAHDMAREHRVLTALGPSDVPVPQTHLLEPDPDVIGAPFYVMSFVDGVILRADEQLRALSPGQAGRLADGLADVLARLHAVQPGVVGLADLGRPDGFLDRQLRRWAIQLAASHSREVPGLDALATRLGRVVPAPQRAALVHGDYRLDNVVIDPDDPGRVRAVLDWEMATLGDPLTDLASAVVWWDGIVGLDSPVAAVPGDVPGFPPGTRLLERYSRHTGLDLNGLPWYLGFAFYKIAAIFEGIHYRDTKGLTTGEGFDRLGAMVPALVERGHAALDQT